MPPGDGTDARRPVGPRGRTLTLQRFWEGGRGGRTFCSQQVSLPEKKQPTPGTYAPTSLDGRPAFFAMPPGDGAEARRPAGPRGHDIDLATFLGRGGGEGEPFVHNRFPSPKKSNQRPAHMLPHLSTAALLFCMPSGDGADARRPAGPRGQDIDLAKFFGREWFGEGEPFVHNRFPSPKKKQPTPSTYAPTSLDGRPAFLPCRRGTEQMRDALPGHGAGH